MSQASKGRVQPRLTRCKRLSKLRKAHSLLPAVKAPWFFSTSQPRAFWSFFQFCFASSFQSVLSIRRTQPELTLLKFRGSLKINWIFKFRWLPQLFFLLPLMTRSPCYKKLLPIREPRSVVLVVKGFRVILNAAMLFLVWVANVGRAKQERHLYYIESLTKRTCCTQGELV